MKSISSRDSSSKPGCVGIGVCILFTLIGGVIFSVFFVRPALKVQEARNWTENPCIILSSEVKTHSDSDSTTYSVEIHYRYHVRDTPYESKRYDFMGGSSSGYNGKQMIVNHYPPGKEAVCYVNPSDPSEAVIDRRFPSMIYLGLIPLLFVLLGLGGLIRIVRGSRKKDKREFPKSEAKASNWSKTNPVSPVPYSTAGAGPVVLKSGSTPLGRFIGLTLVALFWNGIVSIFVVQAVQGWLKGSPGGFTWFTTIFMIPFVLIGIGLIVGAGYQLLAVFNPRIKATLDSNSVPLGGVFNLNWEITGRADKIDRLRVHLKGQEEATYTQGTNTYTDREVFRSTEIFDSTHPSHASNISWGNARVMIPSATIHSFAGKNNKIVWAIHIHGEIKNWPDLMEVFVINVLPS